MGRKHRVQNHERRAREDGGPAPNDPTAASRFLAWALRHAPHAVGLGLDPAGWAPVDAVLQACRARGIPLDRPALARLVATSDKQRFALSPDGLQIRAVQGHSVPVRLDHPEREPPPSLYHGTVARFVPTIEAEGLVGRVVPGLPRARYQVLHRPDAAGHHGLAALLRALHEHRDDWRARKRVAAGAPTP